MTATSPARRVSIRQPAVIDAIVDILEVLRACRQPRPPPSAYCRRSAASGGGTEVAARIATTPRPRSAVPVLRQTLRLRRGPSLDLLPLARRLHDLPPPDITTPLRQAAGGRRALGRLALLLEPVAAGSATIFALSQPPPTHQHHHSHGRADRCCPQPWRCQIWADVASMNGQQRKRLLAAISKRRAWNSRRRGDHQLLRPRRLRPPRPSQTPFFRQLSAGIAPGRKRGLRSTGRAWPGITCHDGPGVSSSHQPCGR